MVVVVVVVVVVVAVVGGRSGGGGRTGCGGGGGRSGCGGGGGGGGRGRSGGGCSGCGSGGGSGRRPLQGTVGGRGPGRAWRRDKHPGAVQALPAIGDCAKCPIVWHVLEGHPAEVGGARHANKCQAKALHRRPRWLVVHVEHAAVAQGQAWLLCTGMLYDSVSGNRWRSTGNWSRRIAT